MNKIAKNLLDFLFGFIGLILLSPILIIISIIIKIKSPGPVLYKQERIGKDGIPFNILKFRTMVVDADKKGLKITVSDDERITNIGKFLRKYKLDELPQIINIVKGEMSFVGPRPEVKRYVDMYTPIQRKVLTIKPGITDKASIIYRNENELLNKSNNPEETYINEIMPHKLSINLKYIEEANIFTDLSIIINTFLKVFIQK